MSEISKDEEMSDEEMDNYHQNFSAYIGGSYLTDEDENEEGFYQPFTEE
jgi:hypothetical protein